MVGGAGSDRFLFQLAADGPTGGDEQDIILDFTHGTDTILLRMNGGSTIGNRLVTFDDIDGNADGIISPGDLGITITSHRSGTGLAIDLATALHMGSPGQQLLTLVGVDRLEASDLG